MVMKMLAVTPETKIKFQEKKYPPYCKSADSKILYLLEKVGDYDVAN